MKANRTAFTPFEDIGDQLDCWQTGHSSAPPDDALDNPLVHGRIVLDQSV